MSISQIMTYCKRQRKTLRSDECLFTHPLKKALLKQTLAPEQFDLPALSASRELIRHIAMLVKFVRGKKRKKKKSYVPNFSPSSMVSGRCLFSVSGRKSARRPANMDIDPNMASGRALPKWPPIRRSCKLDNNYCAEIKIAVSATYVKVVLLFALKNLVMAL